MIGPGVALLLLGLAATELTGTVESVDHQRHLVVLRSESVQVTLRFDRNTLVYRPGGATTPLALAPGQVVRAGHDGHGLAYWLQVRPAP
jgi:hypothetical protein